MKFITTKKRYINEEDISKYIIELQEDYLSAIYTENGWFIAFNIEQYDLYHYTFGYSGSFENYIEITNKLNRIKFNK